MVRGTGRICSRAYTLRPEIYAHSHIYDLARTWPYHELIVTCVDVLTYSGQGCDARHQHGSHVHCGQKLVVGSATLFLWWRNHFLAKFLPVFFSPYVCVSFSHMYIYMRCRMIKEFFFVEETLQRNITYKGLENNDAMLELVILRIGIINSFLML